MSSPEKHFPTPLEVAAKKKLTDEFIEDASFLVPEINQRADAHAGVGVKSCPIKVKTDGMTDGEFIGYASVFGVKDTCGDVVQKGAFAKTLTDWDAKAVPIPLLWGHNTADPDMNIGHVVAAEEDDHGLKVHGRLDVTNPKAAQTYKLLKSGRVNQMSFAYSITDGAYVMPESKTGDPFYSINSVDLYEVSVVPIGANQDTEILSVKSVIGSLAAKAGRTLSAKNEDIISQCADQAMEIAMALKSVLPGGGEQQDQNETTSGAEPPPDAAKQQSGEATPTPSVSLAMTLIEIEQLGEL